MVSNELPKGSQRVLKMAWLGLFISIIVFTAKYVAYHVSGSVALLSDALETIINIIAALVSILTIWLSAQPEDSNHTYGHTKVEYLSALFEGLLMLGTAIVNCHEIWHAWWHPQPFERPGVGLALNAFGGTINLVWAATLIRYGKRYSSPSLVANGRHILTDVYTSAAIIIGFGLVLYTNWLRADPLIAAFVTVSIIWSGLHTMREAAAGLMDELSDPTLLQTVSDIICKHGSAAIEAHDLRARIAGRITFIDFHLVVDASMTVARAHAICDDIEHAIRQELGYAIINIHLEPPEKAKATRHNQDAIRLPAVRID